MHNGTLVQIKLNNIIIMVNHIIVMRATSYESSVYTVRLFVSQRLMPIPTLYATRGHRTVNNY